MIPDFGGVSTLQNIEFEPSGKAGIMQMKVDNKRQGVQFYRKEFYNEFKTLQKKKEAEERGDFSPQLPVYESREMVRIQTPGDRSIYDGIAEDYHKRNYFQQYARFRDGKDVDIGARLSEAEFIQGPEILELNYLGVYSIEQMANAADTLCDRIPRGYEIREGCRCWIQIHQGNAMEAATKKISAELSATQSMLVQMRAEADQNKRELDAMRARLTGLSTESLVDNAVQNLATKRKGGRPKKNKEVIQESAPETSEDTEA